MKNNELITELLKYDGWVITETSTAKRYRLFNGEEIEKGCYLSKYEDLSTRDMLYAYLTDMNILHRIAVKVVANISGILDNSEDLDFNLSDLNSKIVTAIFCDPNEQGEHIQLATALVNAIKYIQNESINRL